MTDVDIQSVAMSLIAGASRCASTESSGLEFSYAVDREMSGDEVWWSLRLGAWLIRFQNQDDLQILINVHKALLEESPHWDEVSEVRRHQSACQATILEFQEVLTPDAKLRRLISAGHCDLCPSS